ncbi:molybdopterin-binding protein [Flavobacterium sp.]|uniref:molybdopterin-binding protein n=1 Tax=Flavobacterium sp. TaxID=239 RepID=UPI00261C85D6|nr:molybdopterin-binding protein [Flavobacterium sp.]
MKKLASLLLLFGYGCIAQNSNIITLETPTAKPVIVTYEQLKTYTIHSLDSLQIRNHALQYKSTLRNCKGILLKEVLHKIALDAPSPKVLSEFYIVCIATDGYKVVFSWNELFNSPTGEHTLILMEINGISTSSQKDGIAILTPTDFATGRRYVKNLKSIKIERVK